MRTILKKTLYVVAFMLTGLLGNTAGANPADINYYEQQNKLKKAQGIERISHINIPYGHYYELDGKQWLCYREGEPLLVAMDSHCVIEQVKDDSVFSLRRFSEEVIHKGPGLSPQQYLDERFGAGNTRLIKTVHARSGMLRILGVYFEQL